MAKTKIGKVKILLKGEYNANTQYIRLDGVTYNGSFYICKQDCQGINVDNQEYWQLAAEKGDKPINGVDYNTEEEKAEFKKEIISEGKTQLDEYNVTKKAELDAKEVELEGALTNKKDELIIDIDDTLNGFEDNVEQKVADFNTNASEKTASFNQNAQTQTSAFDSNAETQTEKFNTNATSKTNGFDTNATEKTTSFDTNATEKTTAFDTNATSKTNEYNSNATQLTTQTDDLFDALTTNEASGTELYIEDAKACRILNTEIDGMYKQETTSGKNLLEVVATSQTINGITFTINKDKTVTVNGTANGNSILILNSFDFQNGETYILNGCPKNGGINSYKLDAFSQTGLSNDTGNGININVGGQRNIRIVIFDGNRVNNLVFKPMIIKGSEATEYEPYTGGNPSPNPDYQQEIKQVESVKLNIKGKNLCDGINQNYYLNNDVNICGKTTGDSGLVIDVQDKAYVTVSTKIIQERYRIACVNILPQDEKNIVVAYRGVKKDNTSATVTANTTGYKYLIINATDLSSILVEAGSVATEYEPYQNQTINIDLKGNKLCAVSDIIKDKLLIDRDGNVALQKNIGEVIFNGNGHWELAEKGFYNSSYFVGKKDKKNFEACCNYFLVNRSNKAWTGLNHCGFNDSGYFWIQEEHKLATTSEGFNEWLTTHNLEVYYVLATPKLIDLGQLPELPKTFNGINNIWAETNLGNTEIEVEYVQDVKKLIENLQALALDNATTE